MGILYSTYGNLIKESAGEQRKLLVLDYFVDGYRFGIKPTGPDRTSVGYSTASDQNNLDYFDYSGTFPNGIPYGVFDGLKGSENQLVYDLTDDVTSTEDVVTIEFLLKCTAPSDFSTCCSTQIAETKNSVFMPRYDNVYFAYSTNSGSWDYQVKFPNYALTTQIFTGSTKDVTTWHHYKYTKIGNLVIFTLDGIIAQYITNIDNDNFSRFKLTNALLNANNYNSKMGSYRITQLAIYKWLDVAPPFTLSKTLYVDTPMCPDPVS